MRERCYGDMFVFLGLDPDQTIDASCRHNETVVPRSVLKRGHRRILGNVSLRRWLPTGVGRALREFCHRQRRDFAMDPDDRRTMIDYYRDEILCTADPIGRDLSAWLR